MNSKLLALCAIGAMLAVSPAQAIQAVTAEDRVPETEDISRALTALKSEPLVDEVLYQSGDNADWSITISGSKAGYAEHVCNILRENGVLRHETIVRVIDTSRLVNNLQDFRASNKVAHCIDLPMHFVTASSKD